MIITHRWLSGALGLLLVVFCTSGAILVYRTELVRLVDRDAFSASGGPARVTPGEAVRIVLRAHPGFRPASVTTGHGVLRVANAGDTSAWTVDPATGALLGHTGGGPTWLRFLENLHRCALDCPGQPGYQAWLGHPVPGTAWLGGGKRVTGGSLILAGLALVLVYLVASGVWLWFPRRSRRSGRWRRAMTVRRDKGRFARDTDLHKVAGVIALPFLLYWAVTGAGARIVLVPDVWFAATGSHRTPVAAPTITTGGGTELTPDQVAAAVAAAFPHDRITRVQFPADARAPYLVWTSTGIDPTRRQAEPGNRRVQVDRHTGVVTPLLDRDAESASQFLWGDWKVPLHSGSVVGPWWRLPWFLLGLSPLLLGATGTSTWLWRRRTRRNRRRLAASAPAVEQHGDQAAQHGPHKGKDKAGVGQH